MRWWRYLVSVTQDPDGIWIWWLNTELKRVSNLVVVTQKQLYGVTFRPWSECGLVVGVVHPSNARMPVLGA